VGMVVARAVVAMAGVARAVGRAAVVRGVARAVVRAAVPLLGTQSSAD
jgi:hypothetical protein